MKIEFLIGFKDEKGSGFFSMTFPPQFNIEGLKDTNKEETFLCILFPKTGDARFFGLPVSGISSKEERESVITNITNNGYICKEVSSIEEALEKLEEYKA